MTSISSPQRAVSIETGSMSGVPSQVRTSRRFTRAATAENERLQRELARLDGEIRSLAASLSAAERQRAEIHAQVELLLRVAGNPRLHVVAVPDVEDQSTGDGLRGSQIRITAVRVAAEAGIGETALHYRAWYALLTDRGLRVAGRDPMATFLTQLGRSPVVRHSPRQGEYSLDYEAPTRLRFELARLRAELTAQSGDSSSAGAIAAARLARAKLSRTIAAVERDLEEALRLLGPGGGGGEQL